MLHSQLTSSTLQNSAVAGAYKLPNTFRPPADLLRHSRAGNLVESRPNSLPHISATLASPERPSFSKESISTDDSAIKLNLAQKALEKTLEVKSTLGHTTTDLKSNDTHRFWVGMGASAILIMTLKSAIAVSGGDSALLSLLGGFSAYILADLGTGIYHWGVDNYGDANTPVFGPQIDAFQGHHQRPYTIAQREVANNLHALARPAFFFLFPFFFTPNNAFIDEFLSVFLACVVLSQQFHAWSHTRKGQLPKIVVKLQDMGLLVGRKMHGAHHMPPYNINYCIVSGICNKALDSSGFFLWSEKKIFDIWGIAPRSWGETAPEWLEIDYYEDGLMQEDN